MWGRTNTEHWPVSGGYRERFPTLVDRVPTAFFGGRGVCQVSLCGALAAGLRLPRLRHEQSMGAANQTVDMGMRRVRSSDLGDRRDDHAPLQAAAYHLVLCRLSDGHPL